MTQHKPSRHLSHPRRLVVLAVLVAVALLLVSCSGSKGSEDTAATVTDADIRIAKADIGGTPKFYPATVGGEKLEVLVLKAGDGSIRTAFNTCQVCYDSGRGYYQWQDGALVCQNCGNRFAPDQVEVESGGCNPVPIFDEATQDSADSITIPLSYLQEQKALFANWGK